jgi:hypothetical protein
MKSPNITKEAEQTIDLLVKLAHYVEPLEHVSGRIRMRVPLANLARVVTLFSGIDLEKGMASIPGLKGYDVNPWLRCATIRYDPNVLSADLWDGFCAMKEDPSTESLVRRRLFSVFQMGAAQGSE